VTQQDSTWRETVDSFYSEEIEDFYERGLDKALDESLHPRGPDVLFDIAAELGASRSTRILDVGSRIGKQMIELRDRFGSLVVGVEPAKANLGRMRRTYPNETLDVVRAVGEALPFPDAAFDLIWVRDVLVHFESLDPAFVEFRRVLKPSGAVLVFAVFATPLLEPVEAERLFAGTAVVASSADRLNFERAAVDTGLVVERREVLHGEWREFSEESGEKRTSGQLLRVARMVREPEKYKAIIGEREYEEELANCLYGIYQLLGKLTAAIYVLRAR
jgi:ubiquinone/menaquinone biosynthesis C-methylase UbiE